MQLCKINRSTLLESIAWIQSIPYDSPVILPVGIAFRGETEHAGILVDLQLLSQPVQRRIRHQLCDKAKGCCAGFAGCCGGLCYTGTKTWSWAHGAVVLVRTIRIRSRPVSGRCWWMRNLAIALMTSASLFTESRAIQTWLRLRKSLAGSIRG